MRDVYKRQDINYVQVSPSKRDVSNTLSGTGTLNPANTYNVKSLVAGKVLTSSFEEGDIVEEGTVLYTVDSSDATTKVEQASIALQQAQRSYDKTADRQYVRAEVAGVVPAAEQWTPAPPWWWHRRSPPCTARCV